MPIDALGYVAEAIWVANARNGGGTYDPESFGYRWRIVLHTIEGSASPSMIAGHAYPPHLWYDPATRKLYQTVPLSRSAFALYQASDAPHYTNRARALQVEIAGRSADTPSWPQQWLDNITQDVVVPLCRWVAQQGGSINLNNAPAPGAIPNSATVNAPQRFSPTAWALFDGLCSHRHIPMGDDHWDTGGLDTPRIAQHAAMIIGSQLADTQGRSIYPTETDDDMAILVQLQQPGDAQHESMWVVDGIFKRKLASFAEAEALVQEGVARKLPNGALFASWPLDKLRRYTTVDEWSLAGLPGVVTAAVSQQLPGVVSAAVAQQLNASLADLPNRIAMAVASALQPSR